MGQLQDRMATDLKLAGYALTTQRNYLYKARLFAKHYMRSPEKMGEEEIREYLLHAVEKRKVSPETYRQIRASLVFLYSVTLKRQIEVEHLPVRRKKVKVPVVLSGTEVEALLGAVRIDKYRVIIMALYAGGLRISEACRLRVEDIDSKRMLIHIREGKGGDRYTVLSERFLTCLRDYWREHRPTEWLFVGRTRTGYVCIETVRKVFRKAVVAAGITKKITPHVLRHCFATHLMESGVNILVIQALLGHRSIRTTKVYTHMSLAHIGRVKSPLDLLGTKANPFG